MEQKRCPWCEVDDLYRNYHDTIWGIPEYDSHALFVKLCLDGMQAGLSWHQILKREQNYAIAFDQWDTVKISGYDDVQREHLRTNPGIIRNRLKINAIIKNAQAYEMMRANDEDFSQFLWSFVEGTPQINHWQSLEAIPTQTPKSQQMSQALKRKGFQFVGPTICYAFMQATGMVNDHLLTCPAHPDNQNPYSD